MAATGALRGVRVIEFGHYVPGPLLGMLLADQGADVVKVEPPGGDPAREHPAFATWNRGKRSAVLDLKSPLGRASAVDLVRTADVVVENYRPGVAERLGIGYQALSRVNQGIIYCSLPGFGEGNPYRDMPGWEPIVGAAGGMYRRAQGTGEEPLFLPLPVASTYGAITGALSVAMALVARQRGAGGQRIEVPLWSSLFTSFGAYMAKMHDYPYVDRFSWFREVMSRLYQCADGRWVQHQGGYENFVHRTLKAFGHPEWWKEIEPLLGRNLPASLTDPWVRRFEGMFRQRSAQEWEDAISALGGACVVCRTVDEWLEHPHALAGGLVTEVEDARWGRMKQPGVQVRLRGTPGAVQGRAPLLGEHTTQALGDRRDHVASRPGANPAGPAPITAALQGMRVLDLCIVLAGPTCGRTLGEFGAEVVKIDDPGRPYDEPSAVDVNRGKRSIALDLKSEQGRSVFWRLAEKADVIVENYRQGALDRIGIGYDEVRKRQPGIVFASLNTYGYDGPWKGRPGWEQLAQATSGIQVRRGGRTGEPGLLPAPLNDYGTGLLGAFGVALALFERERTGRGQSVDTGLSLTAGLLSSPYLLSYKGYQRNDPEGPGVRGYAALSRLYTAKDGWFYVHCPDDAAWGRLTAIEELRPLSSDPRFVTAQQRIRNDDALAEEMKWAFRLRPRDEWLKMLKDAGVPAVPNASYRDFPRDPHARGARLINTRDHPGWGRCDHVGPTALLSKTPMLLGSPSPVIGAHTRELLKETGFGAEEVAAMEAAGVVKQV